MLPSRRIIICFLVAIIIGADVQSTPVAHCAPIRFTLPDVEIYPYVLGTGAGISEPAGIAVDLIRGMEQDVCPMTILRLPLKRAHALLEAGKVDATWIADPDAQTQFIASLPLGEDGKLDGAASVTVDFDVFTLKGNAMVDDDPLQWLRGKRIAMIHGTIVLDRLRNEGLGIDDSAPDMNSAVRMLRAGHVDAYIGLDFGQTHSNVGDETTGIVRLNRPLLRARTYLAFSHDFQNLHPDLVSAYWQWLRMHGKDALKSLQSQYGTR